MGIVDATCNEYVFEWFRNWVGRTFKYVTPASTAINTFVNCPICQSFWASLATVWLFPAITQWWFVMPFLCLITAKLLFQKILVY